MFFFYKTTRPRLSHDFATLNIRLESASMDKTINSLLINTSPQKWTETLYCIQCDVMILGAPRRTRAVERVEFS